MTHRRYVEAFNCLINLTVTEAFSRSRMSLFGHISMGMCIAV